MVRELDDSSRQMSTLLWGYFGLSWSDHQERVESPPFPCDSAKRLSITVFAGTATRMAGAVGPSSYMRVRRMVRIATGHTYRNKPNFITEKETDEVYREQVEIIKHGAPLIDDWSRRVQDGQHGGIC